MENHGLWQSYVCPKVLVEHGFVQVPIADVSSLVKPGDKGLLREMGVDDMP